MTDNIEILIDRIEDFSGLFKRIQLGNLDANVNVANYPFFNPKEILLLTEFFVVQNFNKIDATLIINEEIGWYITGIKLIDFCNTNFKIPHTQEQSISTAIPIMRIDVSKMDEYIHNALGFFSKYCNGKDIDILSICISEIINNVNDHSKSPHDAYIFSQYYPNVRQIKFAISDLGVGIPATVNSFLESKKQERLGDIDALKWALQKGKTVKSQLHNMGAGLDNIKTFLEGVGTLEIYTEDVYCKLFRNGKISFSRNPIVYFVGTLIEITIDVAKLDEKDETILDEFVL